MTQEAPAYRKAVNAWCMYDWANSAFGTTIMTAIFPVFYTGMVISGGAPEKLATAYWAYTVTIALAVVVVLAPILGALADSLGCKKRFLASFALIGILGTFGMVFLPGNNYIAGSICYIAGSIGFAGGNVFYEALLPSVARSDDMDRVSTRGYIFGYIGAGLLLVLNMAWCLWPGVFFMPNRMFAVRACFFSVAAWWAIFTVPILRHVPEPPASGSNTGRKLDLLAGFKQLAGTFRQARQYKGLFLFLIAFWLYSDGINTIIKMATVYGKEVGIGENAMLIALVITQFVGIPATYAFGSLAGKYGTKRLILAGLACYTVISTAGYFMNTPAHFFALAIAVGLIQGGTQALSRSLYARLIPKERSGEFFGFYAMSGKFAGLMGPLVFGVVSQFTGTSRMAILSLIFFFVAGGGMLFFVKTDSSDS